MLPTVTVDIGTTSVKLCLFDEDTHLVTSARHATPTRRSQVGESYEVDHLRRLIDDFVLGLDPRSRGQIQRIAITGVGESGGLVRPDLSLASPMILWHDHRGVSYLRPLSAQDHRRIYHITGLPINGNYGLSKAAWAVEHAGAAGNGAHWLNIAEFLAASMTGQRWSEPSLASRTMALDLSSRTWSAEVCALVGLDVDVFPELRPATNGSVVTDEFAARLGLDPSTRVHVAGHDHMVGAVGAGLPKRQLLNSTGTTEGLLFLQDAPRLDDDAALAKLANGLSCTGADYTLFASIPTGGSAFATLQQVFNTDAAELSECLSHVHQKYLAGSIDLERLPLVLPQFRGSPPPTKQSSARGVMAGLRSDTSMEEIVFACFLGMALQFRDVLDLFDVITEQINVIGPAGKNPLWLQLKADLLGLPVSASQLPEVVSRGAQAVASGQSRIWSDTAPSTIEVDPQRHALLTDWSRAISPQWDNLKAISA